MHATARPLQRLKPPAPWRGTWEPISGNPTGPRRSQVLRATSIPAVQVPSVVTSPSDGDSIHPDALQNIGTLASNCDPESLVQVGHVLYLHVTCETTFATETNLRQGLLASMWKSAWSLSPCRVSSTLMTR